MPDGGATGATEAQEPQRARVAVFISGTGTNMAALLYASRLPDAAFEIVLVASNMPDAPGLALAKAEGVAVFAHSHAGMTRANHDAIMERAARDAGGEYIALAGYMRIVSDGFAERWAGRMVNIHPSLLPKYRGLHTHRRALEAGDRVSGATVHLVSPELDGGAILGCARVAIMPGDTPDDLAARVRLAEHQLYPATLGRYVSRAYDADWLLHRVRELALAFPDAEERDSHGSPAWHTGGKGKFFAHFSIRHHGAPHIALLAKTSGLQELTDLVDGDPTAFFRPAYYGASGWVGLILNRRDADWDQVAYWLERSWSAVASKSQLKLRKE